MKVDWKFFEKFEAVVKNDPVVKQKYEEGDVKGVEEYVKREIFNKPEDHFNLEKLRKSVKADRRITRCRIYRENLREYIEI
jgi:type I restriction enzyme, R subunit